VVDGRLPQVMLRSGWTSTHEFRLTSAQSHCADRVERIEILRAADSGSVTYGSPEPVERHHVRHAWVFLSMRNPNLRVCTIVYSA
jgi:hypothetical protein